MGRKFKAHSLGYFVENGKVYEYRRGSVAVSKAWPPTRREKTRKNPCWHRVPMRKTVYSYFANQYSVCVAKGEPFVNRYSSLPEDIKSNWLPVAAKFYDPIPLEVRELLLNFDPCYKGVWELIDFCAHCSKAVEIVRRSPAIGIMVANLPAFRRCGKRRWSEANKIAGCKRRDILGYLGWPAAAGIVGILSRIPQSECDMTALLKLRSLLRHRPEIIKPLTHIRIFDNFNLKVLCDSGKMKYVGWHLFEEISYRPDGIFEEMHKARQSFENYFDDVLRMEKMLGIKSRPIPSIASLEKRHEHAMALMHKGTVSIALGKKPFPPPPVPVPPPGPEFEISPIDSPVKLYEEGVEQKNCAFYYSDKISSGKGRIYFYSLIRPERATVRIAMRQKEYVIEEIKRCANQEVAETTLSAAKRWLAAYSAKSNPTELSSFKNIALLPGLNVPEIAGLETVQLRDPAELLNSLEDFHVRMNEDTVQALSGGASFVFQVSKPERLLLLVSRNKTGVFSYAPYMALDRMDYMTEKLLDAWTEKLAELNPATDIPEQMTVDFGKFENETGRSPELAGQRLKCRLGKMMPSCSAGGEDLSYCTRLFRKICRQGEFVEMGRDTKYKNTYVRIDTVYKEMPGTFYVLEEKTLSLGGEKIFSETITYDAITGGPGLPDNRLGEFWTLERIYGECIKGEIYVYLGREAKVAGVLPEGLEESDLIALSGIAILCNMAGKDSLWKKM